MRTHKDFTPYESDGNRNGVYDSMIKSNPDKTAFHRKPWYMTCNKPKKKEGDKCEP